MKNEKVTVKSSLKKDQYKNLLPNVSDVQIVGGFEYVFPENRVEAINDLTSKQRDGEGLVFDAFLKGFTIAVQNAARKEMASLWLSLPPADQMSCYKISEDGKSAVATIPDTLTEKLQTYMTTFVYGDKPRDRGRAPVDPITVMRASWPTMDIEQRKALCVALGFPVEMLEAMGVNLSTMSATSAPEPTAPSDDDTEDNGNEENEEEQEEEENMATATVPQVDTFSIPQEPDTTVRRPVGAARPRR